jgi:cyclomaltodextrin glucanotransferase
MPRFQSLNPDPDLLKVATILIMTARGIPCIYYGTEQYLHNDTEGGDDPYNRPMMDHFDTETPLYKIISILSKLRKTNAAISKGSQTQVYLTPEVFCFARKLFNHRCLVALNQSGEEQTIAQPFETHMEDGDYYCQLTSQKYTIEKGKLAKLIIPAKSGIVLSKMGAPVTGKTVVRAECNGIETQVGDKLYVVGNCPELGCWDLDKAVLMDYINANAWYADIPFNESAGKAILYKYVVIHEGRPPLREDLPARKWILRDQGEVKWRDRWSSKH